MNLNLAGAFAANTPPTPLTRIWIPSSIRKRPALPQPLTGKDLAR